MLRGSSELTACLDGGFIGGCVHDLRAGIKDDEPACQCAQIAIEVRTFSQQRRAEIAVGRSEQLFTFIRDVRRLCVLPVPANHQVGKQPPGCAVAIVGLKLHRPIHILDEFSGWVEATD